MSVFQVITLNQPVVGFFLFFLGQSADAVLPPPVKKMAQSHFLQSRFPPCPPNGTSSATSLSARQISHVRLRFLWTVKVSLC